MKSLVKAARRAAFLVWRLRLRASLHRTDKCRLAGLDLVIAPGVLHPAHFASSRILAERLSHLDLHGRSVVDLGTGSGLLALVAARGGARVLATDISGVAVECARANAQRNALSDRVSVLESDVWDNFPAGTLFDLVVTNPPFYPRAATSIADHAFASGDRHAFFSRLAHGLRPRLHPEGALLLIHSSDEDFAPIARILEDRGLRETAAEESRGLFETLTIREFRAEHSPGDSAASTSQSPSTPKTPPSPAADSGRSSGERAAQAAPRRSRSDSAIRKESAGSSGASR